MQLYLQNYDKNSNLVPLEQGIVHGFSEKHTIGHVFQNGSLAGFVFESDAVTNFLSKGDILDN